MLSNITKSYSVVITLLFALNCYSQTYNIHNQFKEINFSLLNEVIKLSNDTITTNNMQNLYQDDNLFHYYNDKTKNKIIPYGYEIAYPFVGETAIVKYNNNWGLIDHSGKFIYYSYYPNTVKLSSYEKYAIFDNGTQEIYSLRNGVKQSGFIYCGEPASPDYFITKTLSN